MSAAGADPPTARLYVVAAWLPRRERVVVGSLGPVVFGRGWYAYVGSAQRGRRARVARHMRADKPLRWHADHLFAGHPATQAWLVDAVTARAECALAAALAAAAHAAAAPGKCAPAAELCTAAAAVASAVPARGHEGAPRVPTFGASDCGCAGHLVRFPSRAVLDAAVATAAASLNARVHRI